MKLPPLALTAPSLCPRCDAPAMFDDHCVQCALPLRLCGACRGVAGPFDRFCGFCGYELVQGDKRGAVWRLWLLAALVPLAAGLAFGLSPLAFKTGILTGFVSHAQQTPSQMQAMRSAKLGFTYAVPDDWTATDYTKAGSPQPFVVVSRLDVDRVAAANLSGEVITTQPAGVSMTLGRPPLDVSAVDAADPLAVLAFQVSQLVATPPAGVTYRIVEALLALAGRGRVLELAVGTGRVALPLVERGVEVEGVDISEQMVARLRAKAGGEGVKVTMGDFAEVPVAGRFRLVYIVFNTLFALLTQEDQLRCFENVAAHLEPDGAFVLECFHPDLSLFDRGQHIRTQESRTDR